MMHAQRGCRLRRWRNSSTPSIPRPRFLSTSAASNSCSFNNSSARSPERAPTAAKPAAPSVCPSNWTSSGSSSTTRTLCIAQQDNREVGLRGKEWRSHLCPLSGILGSVVNRTATLRRLLSLSRAHPTLLREDGLYRRLVEKQFVVA